MTLSATAAEPVTERPIQPARPPTGALARCAGGCLLVVTLAGAYLALAVLGWLHLPVARLRRRLDAAGSAWFARFACREGALLIKIGQFIATRPDLFPEAWITACAGLRDQAPPQDIQVVRASLARAYGEDGVPFAHFDRTPLASASFGQVHRAELADGSEVAVKVQHPGLERLVAIDLSLVRIALRLMRLAMPSFPFHDLVDQLERTARAELDYLQEAEAMDRLRPILHERGLDCPEVDWEHTRTQVLVMEFIPGQTLARMGTGRLSRHEREELAGRIIDAYLGMLLEEGFYHADPHAGNLIYDHGRLVLIDFGMTASISMRQAELYRRLLACVQRRDIDGMLDVMARLGCVMPQREREQLHQLGERLYHTLAEVAPQSPSASRRPEELRQVINDLLLHARGLILPQHSIMLLRAGGMLEGLMAELVPESSLMALVRPILARRLTLWMRLRHLVQEFRELTVALQSLPERIGSFRRGVDRSAHAIVACSAVVVALVLVPPGTLRDVAVGAGGLGAVWAMLTHRP